MMKGLNAVQVEQLRQIGDYLRQVREAQSVSLEKVAKDTFIPLRLLSALEVGEVERLPEPIYIKGFIRRYADVLELDGAEIADAFEATSPLAPAPQPQTVATPSVTAPSVAPSVTASESRRSEPKPTERTSTRPIPGLAYILSGVAAVAVLGAIALSLKNGQFNTTSSPSDTRTASTQPTANSEPSTTTAVPTVIATPPATKPTAEAPVQVDISLVDRSWMEVVADGKVAFEGTLAKGEQRTWTAQNTLLIRAGNAGAVMASHNQGQAKPLGRLGDVVDANFSRGGKTAAPTGTPE